MTAHIHSKRRLSNAFQRKDKMDNTDYQIEDYSFEFEEKEWELHPEGGFEGRIVEVRDLGEVETSYGVKRKIQVRIESDTECMSDGDPFSAFMRVNVTGCSPKSRLFKLRKAVLGRDLMKEERLRLRPGELEGKRIGYQIVHSEDKEGRMWANVETVWPVKKKDEANEEVPF